MIRRCMCVVNGEKGQSTYFCAFMCSKKSHKFQIKSLIWEWKAEMLVHRIQKRKGLGMIRSCDTQKRNLKKCLRCSLVLNPKMTEGAQTNDHGDTNNRFHLNTNEQSTNKYVIHGLIHSLQPPINWHTWIEYLAKGWKVKKKKSIKREQNKVFKVINLTTKGLQLQLYLQAQPYTISS